MTSPGSTGQLEGIARSFLGYFVTTTLELAYSNVGLAVQKAVLETSHGQVVAVGQVSLVGGPHVFGGIIAMALFEVRRLLVAVVLGALEAAANVPVRPVSVKVVSLKSVGTDP